MSNEIDLLFKRTLENHRIEPGKNTWGAIEGKLVKKNNNHLWIRLAASLVLGALFLVFWTKPTAHEVSPNALTVNVPEPTIANDEQEEVKENTVNKTSEASQPVTKRQPPQKHFDQKTTSQPIGPVDLAEKKLTSNELKPQAILPVEEKSTFDEVQINKQTPPIGQSIVLVYNLPAIEPKADKPETRDNIHKTEKHNNLKKVLELAGNLRTGESNLNSVRQTKNEILAFNFIKNEKNN